MACCQTCRWWSETCAQDIGKGLEALCESPDGPYSSRMTTARITCYRWQPAAPPGREVR